MSTLCFARFAKTGQIRDGLTFGTAAAITILTHGDAWALGLMPGIAIALTNRWYLLRRPGLWLATLPVLITCVPWYAVTLSIREGSWLGNVASYWIEAAPAFARIIYLNVGLPVLIFALIGVWQTIIRVRPRTEVAPEWAALGGLGTATFILHCLIPVGTADRYIITLVAPICLFSAAGVDFIASRFGARLPIGAVRIGLALALMAVFSMESFALPLRLRNTGYEALVRDVMPRVSNIPQVWLISSDSLGEGCLVAAVALQEARPNSYVLRARTILGGGDLFWGNMEDRFETPAKLAALLDDLSITIIVIDDQIPPDFHRPYQDRLRQLVSSEDEKMGTHRVVFSSAGWDCVPEFLARLCSAPDRFPYRWCARDPARSAEGFDGSKGIALGMLVISPARARRSSRSMTETPG